MRFRFPLFCLAVAVVLVSSCSKDEAYHPQPTTLIPLHTSINVNASGSATLRFDELVSDSRCPANALCAWGGIAIARFTFQDGRKELPLMLSVMPGYPKQDTIVNGYYIEFSDIKPYPGIPSGQPGKEEVQAEVRIHRLR